MCVSALPGCQGTVDPGEKAVGRLCEHGSDLSQKDKAVNIILVHNHPSGDPTPSRADRELTDNVAGAGEQMDIPLLDHIIIGDNSYTSFKEQKLLR